ncbi:MAG: molybdopterin-dependent oxidoreductase [Pseudomonadota bacterium]
MATTTAKTMCPMNCHPTLCGMEVTVSGNTVTAIRGNSAHPDSRGFLCLRGRAAIEIPGNPRRLLAARMRSACDRPWQEIGWDGALDRIAAAMRAVGPQAVGLWQGHGNAVNDYGVGVKRGQMERFANLYGCQSWDPAMICWGLGGLGLGLTGALETTAKEEIEAASDLILLWGANTVSQAHTMRHVEAARRRGARAIAIDVRRTEAAAICDETHLIRPGADADLALAMMHVILREGLEDRAFIADHTEGIAELRTHLAPFTPGWAAMRCNLPAQTIAALARQYARARPGVIVIGGSSMHKGRNGWQAARAIACLPALAGHYGQPGGGLGPRHGARSHGAGFADIAARDRRPPGPPRLPNQMPRLVEAIEDGSLRVLFALGSNLLSSFPDATRLKAALLKLDLLVAYDIFDNDLTRDLAHIVLPGTIWLEEIGVKATNGYVHLCEPVLPAAGAARPLYALYQGLAARLGIGDVYPWPDQTAAIDAVLDHPATGRATVARLRAAGGSLALNVASTGHPTNRFSTPSGKIAFSSQAAAAHGLPPLPMPSDPPAPASRYPLTLAQGRTIAHFHGFYDAGRALPGLAARDPEPQIWIAPQDAETRGIEDGGWVFVFNDRGRWRARAKVTGRIPAGSVWSRDGWPGFNTLTSGAAVVPDSALEIFPFSVGQARFGAEVEIRPADEQCSHWAAPLS